MSFHYSPIYNIQMTGSVSGPEAINPLLQGNATDLANLAELSSDGLGDASPTDVDTGGLDMEEHGADTRNLVKTKKTPSYQVPMTPL
jgi:hypothetical protein